MSLLSVSLPRPVDVVRWLVASQAQDFSGAKWALGLRTPGLSDADVEREFDQGAFLRTHVLRPTWHFVCPEDLRWLLALSAPRVHARTAPQYRRLGLDARRLARGTQVIARALEGGRHATRDQLRQALARARLPLENQPLAHLLMHAELEAVVTSGPRAGKQQTYALVEERVPPGRKLARDEALVELAGRWLAGRAPATAQDFANWSGLTVREARAALAAVSPEPPRASPAKLPRAHLLSIFDEYLSSYKDRSAICEPAFARRLYGMGSAHLYVLIVDGKVAGSWKRSVAEGVVAVRVTAFRALTRAEERAVAAAAGRYARYLGCELELAIA